jgi:hypothetical protein
MIGAPSLRRPAGALSGLAGSGAGNAPWWPVDALGHILEPAPTSAFLDRGGGDREMCELGVGEREHGGVIHSREAVKGQRRTCPYILAPCKPEGIRCVTFRGGSACHHGCAAPSSLDAGGDAP